MEQRVTLSDVHVPPPGDAVASYPSNVPYELAGRVQDTTNEPLKAETATPVGASESWVAGVFVFGMTVIGVDAGEVPVLFRATTVIVYSASFVNPVITQLVTSIAVHVRPPGEAVAT